MNQNLKNDQGPKSSKSMWVGVAVVFGLMVCAWIAMFFFASKHQPADVRDQPVKEAPAK